MGRKATGLKPELAGYGSWVARRHESSLGLVVPSSLEDKVSLNQKLLRYFILIFFFLLTALTWQSQVSAGQLQLAWTDNSNNEDGFKIERKLGAMGTFSQIATVGVNVTSYTDTNLTDGATYCYRLAAFNSAGTSAYSSEGCATVKSTLSITKTGSGTVTSSPAGINCGSDCNESYFSGTVVTLNATAAAGFVFAGWSGSGCSTGSVAMNGNRTCTATFNAQAAQTFGLSINKTGTGSGTVNSSPAGVNCGSDCSESYTSGTVVVLSALPAAGSVFSGWSGSGCSTGSVTMNGNRTCTATFNAQAAQTFGLSINKTGTGSGTVTSSPAGINCGSDCLESYTSGTVVVLSALPAAGSVFSGWSGSGCSTGSVTMNGSRSCTAAFTNYAFGMSGDVPVLRDYDGDGKADIAVYRNGDWFIHRSSDGGVTSVGWGIAQDIPVPGDYDGDGKTDQAVYRDGVWWILRSSSGGGIGITWGGAPQDIPVPGDYDGDGKTDQAVYRDGVWWILRSSNGGGIGVTWGGAPQDIPVPGDYDGDGKTDQAVYRDGVWWILRSSNEGGIGITWGGAPQDIPVPGDYDGDGKTDQAVYRDGVWWILRSSNEGGIGVTWGGAPQDIPVPGDYDGDGKTDQAVYRDGVWWILRSSNEGGIGVTWGGAPQDIPLN